jgi:hypothetical protein
LGARLSINDLGGSMTFVFFCFCFSSLWEGVEVMGGGPQKKRKKKRNQEKPKYLLQRSLWVGGTGEKKKKIVSRF